MQEEFPKKNNSNHNKLVAVSLDNMEYIHEERTGIPRLRRFWFFLLVEWVVYAYGIVV
jgi:hypothetical protein